MAEVNEAGTLRDEYITGVRRFRRFVDNNFSEFPTVKQFASEISDCTILNFVATVKSILIPQRTNLDRCLRELCQRLGVKYEDIGEEIRAKLIRHLEYFCDLVEELER